METASLKEYFLSAVEEALARRKLDASVHSRAYLVDLLASFARPEQLFRKFRYGFIEGEGLEPLGLKYFTALQDSSKRVQTTQLKDLGDQCLFLTGYFYDYVRQQGIAYVEYHYTLGSTAYASLGSRLQQEPVISELFGELAGRFKDFCMVIGDMHLPELDNEKKLLDVYQRWRKTLDERYASLLLAKGCILVQKEGKTMH
ncbi:MAG TPA: hypothetical protein VJC21_00070 [Candidatus Nanoarchaeia archaeon]|nr:hypothetical protein [Candidatus Nanoarchaeia archaeon]